MMNWSSTSFAGRHGLMSVDLPVGLVFRNSTYTYACIYKFIDRNRSI